MISSALDDGPGGTSRPSACAVFKFITNSNLVGCTIGRSAGFSPENPAGVDAGLTIGIGEARAVARQAAGRGKFTSFINRRNGMARCQRNDSIALAVKERVGVNQQRSGA
jgi:hypothetical protein